MQPDLPETYYLDNVLILFSHVETLYTDILDTDVLSFLHGFRHLPVDSQKLYIRLLNRKPQIFRLSKLNYTEISSSSQAMLSLREAEFVQVDNNINLADLLALFTKSEVLKLSSNANDLKPLRRDELHRFLIDQADTKFYRELFDSDCFLEVLHKDTYQQLQMMFFGNLNQSMTDFVLRDLGLSQYESYRIDISNRPYASAQEIEQHWCLHQLDLIVEQLLSCPELSGKTSLDECFELIPKCEKADSPAYRKAEKMRYKIARQLERENRLEVALSYYQSCRFPPARERIVRILHKQSQIEGAFSICREILDKPFDDSELQFAQSFLPRFKKQISALPIDEIAIVETHSPEIVELELAYQPGVELAVAGFYTREKPGQQCFYMENTLFNGVLGLLIWEAIFTPVSGAFYNPFQYRPNDFYTAEFVDRRRHVFDPLWASIYSIDDIRQPVLNCWQNKQGLSNPLVDWRYLSTEVIELALNRIELSHWLRIFERILRDLRHNRAGFPDLILFPPDGGYCLLEVKGPGDKLQKNQQRWMDYFAIHGIPHQIIKVSWEVDTAP